MFLAFSISDIIKVPFGYLMSWLYQLTNNYGVALILFSVLVKLILSPTTAKSKKNSMKMSRLTPRIQVIQKKYENDQQKQNEAIQKLYKEEGVSMGGSCLWSLLPLLIIFPLYAVVRQPITYMLHESAEVAEQIVAIIKEAVPDVFTNNSYYDQMVAVTQIPNFAEELKDIVAHPETLEGLNFTFLGINLGEVPTFNIFGDNWVWNWAHIGAFILPVLSAGGQVLTMLISQKMNNSLVTNEKGMQDKEAAKNSQANQTNKIMLWMMPLMSLWIGFTVPAALSVYWFTQGIVSTALDVILTKRYRKIYDAEDAARLQKALEEEAAEAEKERIRAERRAANPDGITQNTSKKKLQQNKQREQESAKREAAKEYAAKKNPGVPMDKEEKPTLSGIPDRPYAKGRAYDPNRYASDTTEE